MNLFSGATDGHGFGRRTFFLNFFSGATDGQGFGRRIFFGGDLFNGATADRVLGEEVFFEFISWRPSYCLCSFHCLEPTVTLLLLKLFAWSQL